MDAVAPEINEPALVAAADEGWEEPEEEELREGRRTSVRNVGTTSTSSGVNQATSLASAVGRGGAAGLSLRADLHDHVFDPNRSVEDVDVAQAKPDQLTPAHAGLDGDEGHVAMPGRDRWAIGSRRPSARMHELAMEPATECRAAGLRFAYCAALCRADDPVDAGTVARRACRQRHAAGLNLGAELRRGRF
jgi:hypothetical protein